MSNHLHPCPICCERVPCDMDCSIVSPDENLGAHVQCDDCLAAKQGCSKSECVGRRLLDKEIDNGK